MKMYKINKRSWGFYEPIEVVEVEKINDKSVWIKGARSAINSDWSAYFPTISEAKASLLAIAHAKVIQAENILAHEKEELIKLLEKLDKIKE